ADGGLEAADLLLGRQRLLGQPLLRAAEGVLDDEERRDQDHEEAARDDAEEDELVLEPSGAARRGEEALDQPHRTASFQFVMALNFPFSTMVGQTRLLSWWRVLLSWTDSPRPMSSGPAPSSASMKRSAVGSGPARRSPSTKARAARK